MLKKPNTLARVPAEVVRNVLGGVYKCKYLCRNCGQLRLPRPDEMPSCCAACGSTNIDIEKDLTSQRLEMQRLKTLDLESLVALASQTTPTFETNEEFDQHVQEKRGGPKGHNRN